MTQEAFEKRWPERKFRTIPGRMAEIRDDEGRTSAVLFMYADRRTKNTVVQLLSGPNRRLDRQWQFPETDPERKSAESAMRSAADYLFRQARIYTKSASSLLSELAHADGLD